MFKAETNIWMFKLAFPVKFYHAVTLHTHPSGTTPLLYNVQLKLKVLAEMLTKWNKLLN